MRRFTLTATPLVRQGHTLAAQAIGDFYFWGKGVAIDHPQAMTAYKIAAEAGDAPCQHQLGAIYFHGLGVDVDYKQARAWTEKAAAQDYPEAINLLGIMYDKGTGAIQSWRHA